MATMSTNMVMKTKMKGGLSRFLGGESLFINEFSAQGGSAEIGIAPGSPGDMDHVHLSGADETLQAPPTPPACRSMLIPNGRASRASFPARACSFSAAPRRPVVQHLRCHDRNTRGWQLRGRPGHVVAFTGLQYNVESVGGLKSPFLSGKASSAASQAKERSGYKPATLCFCQLDLPVPP